MSRFLAPIHSWLFGKIQFSEAMENRIIKAFKLDDDLNDQAFLSHLYQTIGEPTGAVALEDVIDQSNIHGWLQGRIHETEQRSAALIAYVLERHPEAMTQLEAVYRTAGLEFAHSQGLTAALAPSAAFKLFNDVFLEGMPCDHVNQLIEQDDTHLIWETTHCLHKQYFDATQGDIAHFYHLRGVFLNAAFSMAAPKLTYTCETVQSEGIAYRHQLNLQ